MAEARRWWSPELRATLYYSTVFMTSGATAAYGGIWFQDQGLSSGEIGLIGSVPVFIMLVLNLLVGRIADRAQDWRQVIVIGALLGGLIPIGLFFVHGFVGILLVWTLASLPVAAIGPVADAAALRMTNRNGTDFGFIRAWGTVGYMAMTVATGQIVTWFGGGIFLPFFVALALLRGAAALQLPNFRAPKEEQTLAHKLGASRLREVMKPWFLLPLVGWSMVFATHLVLNSFQALLWRGEGMPDLTIAILIALGAASEAAMMFVFKRFVGRFPARRVILASAVVAVLRWAAMAVTADVAILVPLQLLHSVTFAMGYMGCVHFIANWTSEDIAAEAQSFFQVLQQAMAVVALTAFGWIAGPLGLHTYFASAAFAALGAVLILISMRLMAPRSHGAQAHA
ncbi:MAG TPA: MFS transporter [Devosia sp.]|jgi:PPP family 3-phenylpropionic acid transporter|nr:MFS transporter [Devosia sp.]